MNWTPHKWQAILSGELCDRAVTVVHEIVEALPGPASSEGLEGSLASGSAGLAVLCAYLARADYDDYENAAQFLERASEAVLTQELNPSLYSGFTGIAWATAHLRRNYWIPVMTQTRRSTKYLETTWPSRHGLRTTTLFLGSSASVFISWNDCRSPVRMTVWNAS